MNEDRITVMGVVGSDPRAFLSGKGLPITTFRLASSPRVFDRERGEWRDGETNWYTVSAFRRLADNVAFSLRKGEHVVVTGKLRLRAWQTSEKSGTSAEIDADAVGHDLGWVVTRAQRLQPRETTDAPAAAQGEGAAVQGDGVRSTGAPGEASTPIGPLAEPADHAEPVGFGTVDDVRGYVELDGEALGFVDVHGDDAAAGAAGDPSGALDDEAADEAAAEFDDADADADADADDDERDGADGSGRSGRFSFGRR